MSLRNSERELERRLIVARALAAEHGGPLGFHDEEDQLDWDRKAQAVLRELDALIPRCDSCSRPLDELDICWFHSP